MTKATDSSKSGYRVQVAALPFRVGVSGRPEVLLITSRETRRWVIPKGWRIKGRKDHDAAAIEARQEAGLIGSVGKRPIGHFTYDKRVAKGSRRCRVSVYRLEVIGRLKDWREKDERESAWFSPEEAARRVDEPELAKLIEALVDTSTRTGESELSADEAEALPDGEAQMDGSGGRLSVKSISTRAS